jgi:hypothetical protein
MPGGRSFTLVSFCNGRPLVRALLMSDKDVLGAFTADESVVAAQRELTGQPDYLQLLHDQGLLRPELSVEAAGHLLNCVIQGFFAGAETADPPPLADQAKLPEKAAGKAGLAIRPRPYALDMGSFYTFNRRGLVREIRSFWDTGNFAR